MSEADPSRMWEAADDIDRVLEYVWGAALDCRLAKDQQEETHECSACGNSHARLDEAKYVDMQRAKLIHARRKLDALIAGGSTP